MRLIEQINEKENRPKAPEPNEVESKYVMECLNMDDEGNGMLFGALFENQLLHSSTSKSWYVWGGNIWHLDKVQMVTGLVRHVTDRYGKEIMAIEEKIEKSKNENDPEDHKIFAKSWDGKINLLQKKIKALRQVRGRNACMDFAISHHNDPFTIEGNEFDKDPWLLGVRNGVVDLRSGLLYPGRQDQMISKRCACDLRVFDDNVTEEEIRVWLSPWTDFLDSIYNGDQDLIDFMQRLLGYGLTGLTTEHIFPFLLGRGRNGKSLFIFSVVRVMGDYAATIPSSLFLKTNQPKSSNQTDPGVMKLEGLRFAVASEVEEGDRLSEKEINRLTGGDVLEGRNPYDVQLRNFVPTHLILMFGNHEPVPPAGADGFWDRTFLIRHQVHFVKKDPDPDKLEKLADPDIEAKLETLDEQILYWLVEGCIKWQENGMKLDPPASVIKETEEYKDEADWLGQFLDACCERMDKDTGSTTLYVAFVAWYRENVNAKKNMTPSQKAFGAKMKAKGEFERYRQGDGVYYKGIGLNIEWETRMLETALGS